MRKLVVFGAVTALLGCGTSTEVTLGDSLVVGVDDTPSGATFVQVRVGAHACDRTRVAVMWSGEGAPTVVAHTHQDAC